MKKVLAFILAACMLLAFMCACGRDNGVIEPGTNGTVTDNDDSGVVGNDNNGGQLDPDNNGTGNNGAGTTTSPQISSGISATPSTSPNGTGTGANNGTVNSPSGDTSSAMNKNQ